MLKFNDKKIQLKMGKRLEQTPHQRIYTHTKWTYKKMFRIACHCKLQQQWDTTEYLLEWLRSETLTTLISGEVVGMQNGTATLEGIVGVFCKAKYNLTI